jgi:hypothetical protein
VAQQQLGKPYVYSTSGPNTFDCSGLMQYSYSNGPHLDIGRDTSAQWNNQTVLSTFFDPLNPVSGQPSAADLPNQLEVGDLVYYFQPGNSGEQAHVRMYAGGGKMIEAPYTGQVVRIVSLDLTGDSTEPFRGVKRPQGGGSTGGAAGGAGSGAAGSGAGGGDSTTGSSSYSSKAFPNYHPTAGALPDLTTSEGKKQAAFIGLEDLPDPRSNLPFAPQFSNRVIASISPDDAKVAKFGYLPNSILVHGGMSELMTNTDISGDPLKAQLKQRNGGPFLVYFQMNPQNIATDCSIDPNMASPSQTDPAALQAGPYLVQNQSISFSLTFNRMYEVYMGGFKNPKDGGPGPSDIGVRWDIRAIERLMGIYDAQKLFPGSKGKGPGGKGLAGDTGLGTWGAGDRPPQALSIQVVFGGPMGNAANGYMFQGLISSMDYTYTLFSSDMIPLEAQVDIGIMRVYQPNLSSADVLTPLVTDRGQMGAAFNPSLPSGYNRPQAYRGT